jgi:hypothetical protein
VDPQLLELALVFEQECRYVSSSERLPTKVRFHLPHHFHPEERVEAVASALTSDPMEDVANVARAINAFLAACLGE